MRRNPLLWLPVSILAIGCNSDPTAPAAGPPMDGGVDPSDGAWELDGPIAGDADLRDDAVLPPDDAAAPVDGDLLDGTRSDAGLGEPSFECDAYGVTMAACVLARCANAEPVAVGLEAYLRVGCQSLVARGWLSLEQAGTLAASDCEALGGRVEGLVGAGAPLETLCSVGPALSVETCRASCGRVVACAENDVESEVCAFGCASSGDDAGFYRCAATAPDCQALAVCAAGG